MSILFKFYELAEIIDCRKQYINTFKAKREINKMHKEVRRKGKEAKKDLDKYAERMTEAEEIIKENTEAIKNKAATNVYKEIIKKEGIKVPDGKSPKEIVEIILKDFEDRRNKLYDQVVELDERYDNLKKALLNSLPDGEELKKDKVEKEEPVKKPEDKEEPIINKEVYEKTKEMLHEIVNDEVVINAEHVMDASSKINDVMGEEVIDLTALQEEIERQNIDTEGNPRSEVKTSATGVNRRDDDTEGILDEIQELIDMRKANNK